MLAPLLDSAAGAGQASASTRTGWQPLHFAAGFGKAEAVDLLLQAGADIEARNTTAGHHAGWTPFHRACRWWLSPGKPNCIRHLLELEPGVKLDAETDDGLTAANLVNPEVHEALEIELRSIIDAGSTNESAGRLLDNLLRVRAEWAVEHGVDKPL